MGNIHVVTKLEKINNGTNRSACALQLHLLCVRKCDNAAATHGPEQICSNKGHTYYTYCHLLCDKEFVNKDIKAEYIGVCGSTEKKEIPEKFKH